MHMIMSQHILFPKYEHINFERSFATRKDILRDERWPCPPYLLYDSVISTDYTFMKLIRLPEQPRYDNMTNYEYVMLILILFALILIYWYIQGVPP